MKRICAALVTVVLAVATVVVLASSAGACNDCPGDCGRDVVVAGKTILHIDCV